MPKLKIDNRDIEVPAGTKVIEAAERVGIMIPRFCYHAALGAVGACRVCAVAFKEGPVKGIQMSCMVDAQEGMVVSTTDAEAVDFRRHVIEWLMLHHPHDCPVCDVGGNCLLQDMTVSGGHGLRRYPGRKRTYIDQYLGPFIQHEMNRCIQCYRCSRYYQEYAGCRDLGAMGVSSRIYFGRSEPGRLESPFSGNLLEVCPTGVYTDKPSRYFGRRWEFERAPSICLHCSLGCNTVVSARYRQVVRQEARLNRTVNGYFICDRGRYGFGYASDGQRPREASINAAPRPAGEVAARAGEELARIADRYGPEAVAAVTSAHASLETLAALQQACRQSRWRGPAAALTARLWENLTTAVGLLNGETAASLADVEKADTVIAVGADPLNEAPMLALALRQAQRRGGRVAVFDPRGIELPLAFDHRAVQPQALEQTLRRLISGFEGADRRQPAGADRLQELIAHAGAGKTAVVLCGTDIVTCREVALAAELAAAMRRSGLDAGLFYTFSGANDFAAALTASPGEGVESMDRLLGQIEEEEVRALVAVEADMWGRYPDRRRLDSALARLELLVVMDYVASPTGGENQLFIPTQTVFEAGGRWINQEGRLQKASPGFAGGEPITITGKLDHPPRVYDAGLPGAAPAAAWRLVAELAGAKDAAAAEQYLASAVRRFHPSLENLDLAGGDRRVALDDISEAPRAPRGDAGPPEAATGALTLLLVDWTFGTEPLSSRSGPLSGHAGPPAARMHPEDISRLGLEAGTAVTVSTGGGSLEVTLEADGRMAPGVMTLPRHHLLNWQIFEDTRTVIDPDRIRPA